eukprot:jgi/Mesen1/10009/ME000722S09296
MTIFSSTMAQSVGTRSIPLSSHFVLGPLFPKFHQHCMQVSLAGEKRTLQRLKLQNSVFSTYTKSGHVAGSRAGHGKDSSTSGWYWSLESRAPGLANVRRSRSNAAKVRDMFVLGHVRPCQQKAAASAAGAAAVPSAPPRNFERELSAAILAVEKACQLCLHVRATIHDDGNRNTGDGRLEKEDRTPVTVADFAVQALVALELGRAFPDLPLVGEEDASELRRTVPDPNSRSGLPEADEGGRSSLVDKVVEGVRKFASPELGEISAREILEAIDRGGPAQASGRKAGEGEPRAENEVRAAKKGVDAEGARDVERGGLTDGPARAASKVSEKPYWVLDPIDGTRGFLRGGNAQYVVGLALVEAGQVVVGVMGLPNLALNDAGSPFFACPTTAAESPLPPKISGEGSRGLIVAASLGGGTFCRPLIPVSSGGAWSDATRVRVEGARDLWEGSGQTKICISDHEMWADLPLARGIAHHEAAAKGRQVAAVGQGRGAAGRGEKLDPQQPESLEREEEGGGREQRGEVWDHAAGVICVTEAGGQVSTTLPTPSNPH